MVSDVLLLPSGKLLAATNAGLYASADNGATWAKLPNAELGQSVRSLAMEADGELIVYAATSRSVFVSRDGGEVWQQGGRLPLIDGTAFPPNIFDTVVFPTLPGRVFALTDNGIYASANGGLTWAAFGLTGMWVGSLATDPLNPLRFLAGVRNTTAARPTTGGIFESADGGANWRALVQQVPWANRPFELQGVDAILYQLPLNRWLAAADSTIIYSDDNGATWAWDSSAPPNVSLLVNIGGQVYGASARGEVAALNETSRSWRVVSNLGERIAVLAPNRAGALILGSIGGIAISGDGGTTWRRSSTGLQGASINRLLAGADATQSLYAISVFDNVYRFDAAAARFTPLFPDLSPEATSTRDIALDPKDPAHLLVAGRNALTSRDGGKTWTTGRFHVAPGIVVTEVGLPDVAIDPNDGTIKYIAAGDRVYVTRDDGVTWTPSLEASPIGGEFWQLIETGNTRPTTLYVLGSKGVRRSNDGGATWSDSVQVSREPGSLELRVNPFDANMVYVLTGTLKVSTDGGQTWTETAQDLGLVTDLAFDTRTPNVVYAVAPNVGIGVSRDGGLTWQKTTELGTPPSSTVTLAVDAVSGDVFAASSGDGVWRCAACIPGGTPVNPGDGGANAGDQEPGNGGGSPSSSGGGGGAVVWLLFVLAAGQVLIGHSGPRKSSFRSDGKHQT